MSACRRGVVALAVLVLLPMSVPAAALRPIGLAVNEAAFTAGSSRVQGQATLFEGDAVRGSFFATRLNLNDGSRYVLGVGSEGIVQRGRVLLRSGSVDVLNAGRPSRVTASSVNVSAETPGSAATVYISGESLVTVQVRSGEVKVSRVGNTQVTTLRAGQAATLKPGSRGAIDFDAERSLSEITRVQADQLAGLTEAAAGLNCLEPRVGTLSHAFAGLSVQFAANQSARESIQSKIDRGVATPSDLQRMNELRGGLVALQRASAGLAADLNNVVFQHHPFPGEDPSPHTIHGHVVNFPHHGVHGHSAPPPPGHFVH